MVEYYFTEENVTTSDFAEKSKMVLESFLSRIGDIAIKFKSPLTVYLHNLSRFDGLLLLDYMRKSWGKRGNVKMMDRNHHIYEIKVRASGRRVLFRFKDSMLMLKGSLDSLSKNLCPELGYKGSIDSLKVNQDTLSNMKEDLRKYLKQDVLLPVSFTAANRKKKQHLMENGPQLLFMETKSYLPRSKRCRIRFVSVDMEGRNEELYTVAHPDLQLSCSTWTVCSGLVCLSNNCRIYLCNPAINQLRELPNCSPSAIPGYEHFGFGYLHSRKEYKVVHFFYMGPRSLPLDVQLAQLRCEVFTLNGGGISNSRWKEIAEPPPYHPCSPELLVNECMYWLAKAQMLASAQPQIISFDFENEKFLAISCPSAFETLSGLNLLDLKGTLCLPDFVSRSSILDLWILKDKISCTWVKEYSINLVSFESKNIMSFYRTWNEEIIIVQYSGMVIFFDLKRKCFRGVKRPGSWRFDIYSKSLFSLCPSL